MMRGGHGPIGQLQDLNWGAFDHASHAPQLRFCNYNLLDVSQVTSDSPIQRNINIKHTLCLKHNNTN